MQTDESNLTLAALIYASERHEQGDWAALRELNFGEKEAKALSELQISSFITIARRMRGHPLRIELDRGLFWQIVDQFKQEQCIKQLKEEMIRRKAPVEMMRQLFDMSDRQYTAMRRRCRFGRGAGRPAEPDEQTMDTIWKAWQHHNDGQTPETPSEWLTLSRQIDVDLRTIWRFVRDAQTIG